MKSSNYFLWAFIISTLWVLSGCGSTAQTQEVTSTPALGQDFYIVLGDISDDPTEVIAGSQPLADYLAARLAEFGITAGRVKVATSIEEMQQLLASGEVDLYFDSTYPATLISDATGAQIILRRWRFGVDLYHSVIFTRSDSGIKSISSLDGKMIAMDAPYSTSGFMLPAVYMAENGLNLVGKQDYTAQVAPGETGFAFSYDDENTLQWVLSGHADAGVTDDYHFDIAFPSDATQKLIALARTESTPRQVVLAAPGMDPIMLEAIIEILTGMDDDPAAQNALEVFQTTQFDEFPEGIEAATQRMRDIMGIIETIPLP